jgi:hypothetical protein
MILKRLTGPATTGTHFPEAVTAPRSDACEECGSRFDLRSCTQCGHVGCCESQARHARPYAVGGRSPRDRADASGIRLRLVLRGETVRLMNRSRSIEYVFLTFRAGGGGLADTIHAFPTTARVLGSLFVRAARGVA